MHSRWLAIPMAIGIGLLLSIPCGHAFEPVTFYGFDEATYSPNAREGLHEIFAGNLFHAARPVDTVRLQIRGLRAFQKLGYDLGTPEGRYYSAGRLPSPENRSAGADPEFALGESIFDRDGVSMVNINCFMCHAGVVNGQVVAGMANSHINQSNPRKLRTRGDNFGPYAVWELSARLVDPADQGLVVAKEQTELQKLYRSVPLPPVDPMPWWLMKYKKKDYWYADAGPHDAASFSINFTTAHREMNADHAQHVESVAKALAFARETQSPPYPGALDPERVQQGADLFHGRTRPAARKGFRSCKTCHGSYTKLPSRPDLSQPGGWTVDYNYSHVFRNVKTDEAYNTTLQEFEPIAAHVNQLADYYTSRGTPELIPHVAVPGKPGYVAPPLVGVWASAPYFHNGSVPTLETVLNSKLRPEIWSRNSKDAHAYDLEKVGMLYRSISRSEFEESAAGAEGKMFLTQAAIDHAAHYDTDEFGHGNRGHTFGDNLTDQERFALIEFLKSLSGPEMEPSTARQ